MFQWRVQVMAGKVDALWAPPERDSKHTLVLLSVERQETDQSYYEHIVDQLALVTA